MRSTHPFAFVLLCVLSALSSGCSTTLGSRTVVPTRFEYNEALARSWNEQMLLNLVRLRYRDTPQFLEVSSVLTQFTFEGGAGASVLRFSGGDGDETGADLGVTYSETPTITYTPLQGKEFAERLLTPLSPATIILLSQSGWSIERLMLCCVHQLNHLRNSPSAAGPTPSYVPDYEDFHRAGRILRELQVQGALSIAQREKEETAGAEGSAATKAGSTIVVVLDPTRVGDPGQLAAAREILGLRPDAVEYGLTTLRDRRSPDEIALVGRPLTAVLFFLSQAVEPPAEHEEAGFVTVTRDENGERFDWSLVTGSLFRVRSQATIPDPAFVKVRYRGYWFYIDDRDLNSKTTFGLLHFLFSLQSTSTDRSPLLTVSTGG